MKKALAILAVIFLISGCASKQFSDQPIDFSQNHGKGDYNVKLNAAINTTPEADIPTFKPIAATCFIITTRRMGYVEAPAVLNGPYGEMIRAVSCKSHDGKLYGYSTNYSAIFIPADNNDTLIVLQDDGTNANPPPPHGGISFGISYPSAK